MEAKNKLHIVSQLSTDIQHYPRIVDLPITSNNKWWNLAKSASWNQWITSIPPQRTHQKMIMWWWFLDTPRMIFLHAAGWNKWNFPIVSQTSLHLYAGVYSCTVCIYIYVCTYLNTYIYIYNTMYMYMLIKASLVSIYTISHPFTPLWPLCLLAFFCGSIGLRSQGLKVCLVEVPNGNEPLRLWDWWEDDSWDLCWYCRVYLQAGSTAGISTYMHMFIYG